MTPEEIIEGNKLIAEFLKIEEAKFHSSWDWLIPVVEKITSMDIYIKYKDYSCGQFNDGGIYINTKSIENTFSDVVEFIKWYNKNK